MHKGKWFLFKREGDRAESSGLGCSNSNIPDCCAHIFPQRASDPLGSQSIRQVQCPKIIYHHLEMGNLQTITKEKVVAVVEELPLQDGLIQNSVIAIDISLTVDEIDSGMALQIAQQILQEIDHYYPAIRDRFVGISDDEQKLPLRDLMLTGKLALEEIDNQHLFVFE